MKATLKRQQVIKPNDPKSHNSNYAKKNFLHNVRIINCFFPDLILSEFL